jgi:hypothetical protein
MKRFFILFAVACTAAGARADLVIQQQITITTNNSVATMKIKGTKIRLDMYAGQPQALSTITDLNTGEVIYLMHNQKMYMKSPVQPMKQARSSGTASRVPVPRPTGKTQKVGDYDTELYTWSNDRGITGTVWVAKNYPDPGRLRRAGQNRRRGHGHDSCVERVAGHGGKVTSHRRWTDHHSGPDFGQGRAAGRFALSNTCQL